MKLFSGGASKQGRLLDLPTGQSIPFAQHDAPIKCCAFFDTPTMQNILVTGSWDKTLKALFSISLIIVNECAHI